MARGPYFAHPWSNHCIVLEIAESMEDEPFKAGKSGDSYDDLDHKHTFNLPKNIELLAEFRQVLDNKTAEDVYNPRCV
jgi:hypothetical protein